MKDFEKILSGGDLRSIGKSNSVVSEIRNQKDFDQLFDYIFHSDRIVVMRVADAIEKVTIENPNYLKKHKKNIFELCDIANNKELKWHLALLIPRLTLDSDEFGKAWETLTIWAKDKTNSNIVRVNSVQALFELVKQQNELDKDFELTITELEKENIPSIKARIRKLKNASH